MSISPLQQRMDEQNHGIAFATNKACRDCIFAEGTVQWNGVELKLTPKKCFCEMYEPDDSNGKPAAIAFDGAPCEWYEKKQ